MRPPAPPEANPEWIWFKVSNAYLTGVVFAMLRPYL